MVRPPTKVAGAAPPGCRGIAGEVLGADLNFSESGRDATELAPVPPPHTKAHPVWRGTAALRDFARALKSRDASMADAIGKVLAEERAKHRELVTRIVAMKSVQRRTTRLPLCSIRATSVLAAALATPHDDRRARNRGRALRVENNSRRLPGHVGSLAAGQARDHRHMRRPCRYSDAASNLGSPRNFL